ncbi:MAG: adenylate/guanylate cyclase domain-containing protein [Desulfovibrio sp.]
MVDFNLFEKEVRIIEWATAHAEEIRESGNDASDFEQFLKEYKKLFKTMKRLVRMSDKNEEKLNALAQSFDEKNKMLERLSTKLSKYLSPQVYQSIFSGRQDVSLSTHRKKLTVFFSDIKNFTQITEDLQPEDLTYLLNSYFTEMSDIALEHGATIDKFIGDAMLIFFGDPETKGVKEDARACLQMAMAMQRRMDELKKIWWEKGFEHPFEMRIGINTGYCNVGNFGSEDRMDYTIIGGEVNLAARLEGKSDPGGILMSYETYALVKDSVEVEPREPIHVKGIRREVQPYAVTSIKKGFQDNRRVIRHEYDGFNFFLNLDKMTDDGKECARQQLEGALKRLRE